MKVWSLALLSGLGCRFGFDPAGAAIKRKKQKQNPKLFKVTLSLSFSWSHQHISLESRITLTKCLLELLKLVRSDTTHSAESTALFWYLGLLVVTAGIPLVAFCVQPDGGPHATGGTEPEDEPRRVRENDPQALRARTPRMNTQVKIMNTDLGGQHVPMIQRWQLIIGSTLTQAGQWSKHRSYWRLSVCLYFCYPVVNTGGEGRAELWPDAPSPLVWCCRNQKEVEVTRMGRYLINVPGAKVGPLGTCWIQSGRQFIY